MLQSSITSLMSSLKKKYPKTKPSEVFIKHIRETKLVSGIDTFDLTSLVACIRVINPTISNNLLREVLRDIIVSEAGRQYNEAWKALEKIGEE